MAWKNARLVAYDISDNKRRGKLARYLLRKGIRLQESVFLVDVERHALSDFLRSLESFRRGDDVIDVAPLCGNCRDRSIRLGRRIPSAIVVLGDGHDEKDLFALESDENMLASTLSSTLFEKPSYPGVAGENPDVDGAKGV